VKDKSFVLEGIVARGLGEGAYFMSIPHYQKEIKKKLGFKAYPGTLNLKAAKKQLNLLKNVEPIKINGCKAGNKTLGGADCYKSSINDINGSLIIPDLTKHKGIIEFIAPIHLKSELKIKDGDKVTIKIF